jgi:hypothetical protein
MSYTIEKLPGDPIIVATTGEDFSISTEIDPLNVDLLKLLDAATEPIYYIVDVRTISISVSDAIYAATAVARTENAPFRHPNMKHVIIVTESNLAKLSAKGLDSDVFGHLKVTVVESPDEAFAYVRSQTGG